MRPEMRPETRPERMPEMRPFGLQFLGESYLGEAYLMERAIADRSELDFYPCACTRCHGDKDHKPETVQRHHQKYGRDINLQDEPMLRPVGWRPGGRSLPSLGHNGMRPAVNYIMPNLGGHGPQRPMGHVNHPVEQVREEPPQAKALTEENLARHPVILQIMQRLAALEALQSLERHPVILQMMQRLEALEAWQQKISAKDGRPVPQNVENGLTEGVIQGDESPAAAKIITTVPEAEVQAVHQEAVKELEPMRTAEPNRQMRGQMTNTRAGLTRLRGSAIQNPGQVKKKARQN